MIDMRLKLIFLGVLSWSSGQWINPDEFEKMKAALGTPSLQVTNTNNVEQARNQQVIVGNNFVNQLAEDQPPPAAAVVKLDERWSNRVNDIISSGITKFTLNMDRAISRDQGQSLQGSRNNVIFSPLSISGALALVLLGSAGKTFDEVSRILGLTSGVDISKNSEVVHHMFGVLLSTVGVSPGATPGPQADFASGIFVQEGYPIRREFQTISESVYRSDVINLNFMSRADEAQQRINGWVNEKTHGKIPSILNQSPPPETSVIIASALYFNGEWDQYFMDGATRRRSFTVAPGDLIDVDMMYNGGQFPFFEDRQLRTKIIGLPYKGHGVTMYVVLPNVKGVDALRDLKNRLTADVLETLITNMKNETCILGLPRMKLSGSLSLGSALQSLGLTTLFDPKTADLSLLSSGYNPMTGTMGPGPTKTTNPTSGPQTNQDTLIFTRNKPENETERQPPLGPRRNYFTYVDKRNGHFVEQWDTGFSIRRLRRDSEAASRSKLLQSHAQIDSGTGRTRRHAKHLKRFSSGTERNLRSKRQATPRPIDQDFLNYLNGLNLPSYGLDNLRNNGATTNPGLFASDVLHKVEIDVTEKGTEAAAATSVLLSRDGNQKRFLADHPFLFFIRHESTKLILFWGTVNTPTPNFPRS